MTASERHRPLVSIEAVGPVGVIRYANPPSGLITVKGAAQLVDVLRGALADDCLGALVLTGGEEGVFIRHADVGQILHAGERVAQGQAQAQAFADSPFATLGDLLDRAEKPVIAAINGVCMGGGFEIALACTLRIAAPGAGPIGLPEIRIGLFPGAGGLSRLADLLGVHRARRFVLFGQTVRAREAAELQLVDELADDPLERAIELARVLAGRNRAAVAAILALMADRGRTDMIQAEMRRFGELVGGCEDVRAALGAFLAGDRPLDTLA